MQGTLAVLVSIQGVFQKRKKCFTLTALRDKTVKYSKKSSSYTPGLPDMDFFVMISLKYSSIYLQRAGEFCWRRKIRISS